MFCLEFKRKVFQLLESHNYNLKVLMKDIASIKHSVASGIVARSSQSGSNDMQPNTIRFSLPCTTEAELNTLESTINDEEKFEALVS